MPRRSSAVELGDAALLALVGGAGGYRTLPTTIAHMKICPSCESEFQPSSRHRLCPRCRSVKKRKACPECDGEMDRRSSSCNSCTSRSGSSSGSWKGGKTYHKKGYVMVLTPDRGYVFEHILVMEDHLGRRLFPGETVHHKYGIKDDNRIEQLELWCKPQPSGIRAVDALAWAREVEARYGYLVDKLQ